MPGGQDKDIDILIFGFPLCIVPREKDFDFGFDILTHSFPFCIVPGGQDFNILTHLFPF